MTAFDFLKAFERNCPGVRMTKEEREELSRLFFECSKWASKKNAPEEQTIRSEM